MKIIIDKFEGDFAVCEIEKGRFVNVPKCLFEDAKEGDVISITVDKDETEKRKEKIENLMNDLFI